MNVNGLTKRWNRDGVAEDTYKINTEFRLHNCETPINIRVGGWEKDEGGKEGGFISLLEDNDDPLSDFTATHAAPQADPSVLRAHERRTSNAVGDYTMYYEILKVCKQTQVVSQKQLIQDMQRMVAKAKDAGVEFRFKNEGEVLASALTRLRRGGWDIVGMSDEMFVLEGYMPVGKRARLKEAQAAGKKK